LDINFAPVWVSLGIRLALVYIELGIRLALVQNRLGYAVVMWNDMVCMYCDDMIMMIWLNNAMFEMIDKEFHEMACLSYVMYLCNDMIWINMPIMMHKTTMIDFLFNAMVCLNG